MIATFSIPNLPAWAIERREGWEPKNPVLLAVAEGSRIISLSHPLLERGGAEGESVERFSRRFPEIPLFQRDTIAEVHAWEEMLERLHGETPRITFNGEGLCSCDIPDLKRVEDLARSLDLPAGFAPDLRTSELAAFAAYRGLVGVVGADEVDRWRGTSPVTTLLHYRFSADMVERLEMLGLLRFSSLRRLSKRHLTAQWGREGERLWRFLREEPRYRLPLYRPPLRLIRSWRFESDVLEPYEWGDVVAKLAAELQEDLGGRAASTLLMRLDEGDLEGIEESAQLLPAPGGSARQIERLVSRELLRRTPPIPFARITITLGGIRDRAWSQASLFDRRPELLDAIRRILRRWPHGLVRVRSIDHDAPLPEERVRLDAMRPEDFGEGR